MKFQNLDDARSSFYTRFPELSPEIHASSSAVGDGAAMEDTLLHASNLSLDDHQQECSTSLPGGLFAQSTSPKFLVLWLTCTSGFLPIRSAFQLSQLSRELHMLTDDPLVLKFLFQNRGHRKGNWWETDWQLYKLIKFDCSTLLKQLLTNRLFDVLQPLVFKTRNGRVEWAPALSIALANNSSKCVRLLLDWGLNVLFYDSTGWTPLHYAAAYCRDPSTLEEVFSRSQGSLDIETANVDDCRSPLHCAAFQKNHLAIQLLLKKGAKPQKHHWNGREVRQALHICAEKGSPESCELLIARGCEIETRTSYHQWTPLTFAASFCHSADHVRVVETLLRAGASVHSKAWNGDTPLHWVLHSRQHAASEFSLQAARLLLEKGADPNETNAEGQTVLHLPPVLGKVDLVRELVEHWGATISVRDKAGRTPLEVAEKGETDRATEGDGPAGAPRRDRERGRTPESFTSTISFLRRKTSEKEKEAGRASARRQTSSDTEQADEKVKEEDPSKKQRGIRGGGRATAAPSASASASTRPSPYSSPTPSSSALSLAPSPTTSATPTPTMSPSSSPRTRTRPTSPSPSESHRATRRTTVLPHHVRHQGGPGQTVTRASQSRHTTIPVPQHSRRLSVSKRDRDGHPPAGGNDSGHTPSPVNSPSSHSSNTGGRVTLERSDGGQAPSSRTVMTRRMSALSTPHTPAHPTSPASNMSRDRDRDQHGGGAHSFTTYRDRCVAARADKPWRASSHTTSASASASASNAPGAGVSSSSSSAAAPAGSHFPSQEQ
uniref:Uncharacterized protein n=1 Tax=Chromera velia CCMP2878 TaxID=1169474 RepID=A0A0G4IAW7_9ALVE|mmetsp:Transcript_13689/g.27227  ORF Transcript_13689/g.27227 Transcript_13689/m.27227 type:complete len:777 (+) Transcript_13689:125-2455(+)|eukprot:Cvel_12694.t1-p1 / transcript=Cvel_12694.t1 / gene=Cvel_12694 / organism=Chromera_velia_CCMP2878 / gene_product=Serine/threonine-protein phosphatase 6 regulatory, putative / transcript_product=Serine/threonine-protein phosphatase 6 regulatory, putative / location=Cvel_scaffold840:31422-33948(-) / protein_length=776 / sequence_SO=supercontig / SO=protein_coding / is_pseudo=false